MLSSSKSTTKVDPGGISCTCLFPYPYFGGTINLRCPPTPMPTTPSSNARMNGPPGLWPSHAMPRHGGGRRVRVRSRTAAWSSSQPTCSFHPSASVVLVSRFGCVRRVRCAPAESSHVEAVRRSAGDAGADAAASDGEVLPSHVVMDGHAVAQRSRAVGIACAHFGSQKAARVAHIHVGVAWDGRATRLQLLLEAQRRGSFDRKRSQERACHRQMRRTPREARRRRVHAARHSQTRLPLLSTRSNAGSKPTTRRVQTRNRSLSKLGTKTRY